MSTIAALISQLLGHGGSSSSVRRSRPADPFSRYFDQNRARTLWRTPEDDDPWDGRMTGFSRQPSSGGGGDGGGESTPTPSAGGTSGGGGGGAGMSAAPIYSQDDLDEMDAWFRDPNSRLYDPTYIRMHPRGGR